MADISPVVRRNSEWADTFVDASTNAAQRQRYAVDQQALASQLLDQQQEAQMQELKTNKVAQDLFFRQRDLQRKTQLDKATMDIRHAEDARKEQLFPLQLEAEKAKAGASAALETQRLNKELRDAKLATKVASDTDAFETKMHDLMLQHAPGSKEFAQGALEVVASHPLVPNDLRKTWLAQADVKNDPDQLMRDTAKFRDTHDTTLKLDSKGQWEIALNPKKTTAADPLKQASAIRGQISSTEAQLRNLNSTIQNTVKAEPEWLKSTGAFKAPDGTTRLGYANKKWQDSEILTPELDREIKTYQSAYDQREALSKTLPEMNKRLDGLLTGTATPDVATDSSTTVSPSSDATPPSEAAPHPMEGQAVRQKSTGKMGKIINGQFVAE